MSTQELLIAAGVGLVVLGLAYVGLRLLLAKLTDQDEP